MSGSVIRDRDRGAILQSLRAGVVPRRGLHLVQVGRGREIEALISDLDRVSDSGTTVRFIIGAYGSGKTFFLNLVRSVALEKRLVTVSADLTPERRIYSTGGHARALYAELMASMSTRSSDTGALPAVVERFVSMAVQEARSAGRTPESVIQDKLTSLSEMVGGYDFAQVIECYWRGHDTGDDELKASAIRWLRAEFSTKTDARRALGVRTFIDDSAVYDHLKLMSRFVRLAGYKGLLVCLDEMVNLYKLANGKARNTNYEQILRIVNDCLQGTVEGLGFLFGGTPEFLTDTRRGLYSYEALQSRLAENSFATEGISDLSGPTMRLSNLSPEDVFVLLGKIRNIFARGDSKQYLVPDEALEAFMTHCNERVGEAYYRTPRNTIKEFVHLLAVLEQQPELQWSAVLGRVEPQLESNPDDEPLPEDAEEDLSDGSTGGSTSSDDDLTSFQL
jgi:BREX system ATP-binding protein BrxC/D